MNFVCWIDWKKNTLNSPKRKNRQFSNGKILKSLKKKVFFLIKAKFTTQAERNSQNMPKCEVFLQHMEKQDRLKSYSFFHPPPAFIDS